MALKEYRIWTDSSNAYQHVTGEGFDGDEQLNGIETLRAILIHALYSGYREILVNGRKLDVLAEAMGDRYLSKYYDCYIARMRYTETPQSLAMKTGLTESRIRRLAPELEKKGLAVKDGRIWKLTPDAIE
ncbi:MAG: hypothetical protein AB9866_08425 [Syntrophobacteraceae bacterium]